MDPRRELLRRLHPRATRLWGAAPNRRAISESVQEEFPRKKSNHLAQDDPPAYTQILQTGQNQQHMSLPFMHLRRNPRLQSVRFFLQTRRPCKFASPSRHSLALRAHRHRLSAVARKKMVRPGAQRNVAASEKS